jgi:predicted dehydrogenase
MPACIQAAGNRGGNRMGQAVCRWGILGAAVIAQKNWLAILNSGNGVVAAVASRDPQRAADFIRERQTERPQPLTPAACRYEELLQRADVDAVYIPLPTGIRKEWVIRAAEAGKHVLCEKPCAISASDLREMLAACRQHNVQFMDGVMFMHSQRLEAMRGALNHPANVGQIRRIQTHFSFCATDDFRSGNIRMSSRLEPQGCLGDLGWYTIRFTLWAMNYRMPQRVVGRLLVSSSREDSPAPVPMEFSAELLFEGGVSAGFFCSFQVHQQATAVISGDRGYIHLSDFVLPNYGNEVAFSAVQTEMSIAGCDFRMENHARRIAVSEFSDSDPNSQEANMFRTFGKLALGGQPDHRWGDIALQTQRVLDACLDSALQDSAPVELEA